MRTKETRAEQGESTREALIATARELFGTHGYARTSLEAIVQSTGVTKGAFYHHFSGKVDIFECVFEQLKRELSRAAFITHRDPTESSASGSVVESFTPSSNQSDAELWSDLLRRCRTFIELHTQPPIRRIVLRDAPAVLDWEVWHRIENEHGVVLLRADLRRLMNRGVVRRLPLQPLSHMLAGALNEACFLVSNAENRGASLDESMMIVESFLEGLRLTVRSEPA